MEKPSYLQVFAATISLILGPCLWPSIAKGSEALNTELVDSAAPPILPDKTEVAGRVLASAGSCRIYRGLGHAQGRFRSLIREGDDLVTSDDGQAWLALIDGGLVRLGPRTSVTLKEVNLSTGGIFFHLRINYGQVFWISRPRGEISLEEGIPTDTRFLPLALRMANPTLSREGHLELDELSTRLRSLALRNDRWAPRQTRALIVGSRFRLEVENPMVGVLAPYDGDLFLRRLAPADFGVKASIDSRKTGVDRDEELVFRALMQVQDGEGPRYEVVQSPGDWTSVGHRWQMLRKGETQLQPVGKRIELEFSNFPIKRIGPILLASEMVLVRWGLRLYWPFHNGDMQLWHRLHGAHYRLWDPPGQRGGNLQERIAVLRDKTDFQERHHLRVKFKYRLRYKKLQGPMRDESIERYYALALADYSRYWWNRDFSKLARGDTLGILRRRNQSYGERLLQIGLGQSESPEARIIELVGSSL